MPITPNELKDRISSNLGGPLEELWQALNLFAKGGGLQEDALSVLEQLRVETESEVEQDRILELLDFATGFCAPIRAIWRPEEPA